jgi:hypothetical protein
VCTVFYPSDDPIGDAMLSAGYLLYLLHKRSPNDSSSQDSASENQGDGSKTDFESRLRQIQEWLNSAKIAHIGEPIVTYDTEHLKQQLKDNQVCFNRLLAGFMH